MRQHLIKSFSNVPVVVITASVMDEFELEEREIFDGFLAKPVLKSVLYREMKKHLAYDIISEDMSDASSVDVLQTLTSTERQQQRENAIAVADILTSLQSTALDLT